MSGPEKKTRLKELAKNTLFSMVTLVAFVGIGELFLQFVMPIVYRARFTRIDPEVGWYHQSSVSTVANLEGHKYRSSYNEHGYRSPEHPFEKPPGSRRVVLLGDSFIDGAEVGDEELHSWHLQQAMSGVEVINLGVYGYSTAQQELTLQRALRYSPDLVVVVTVTNDFKGNAMNLSYFGPAPRYVLDGDSVRLESTTSPPAKAAFRSANLRVPGMAFLHEHSLVYYFLNNFVYQRLIAKKIDRMLVEQAGSLSRDDQLELYRRLIVRMKQQCDERGVDFLVVFAYELHEVRGHATPNEEIIRRLSADSVPTLDLLAGLRQAESAADDSSIYYREDIHWNAKGHRVVAELLRPELEKRLGRRAANAPNSRPKGDSMPRAPSQ